jgi:phosphoribosyl 1,2-cyclic phosphate phosphodiesterase
MKLIFLGTGAAWGLPELNCDCMVCLEMRRKEEKRTRPSVLLTGKGNVLMDCGPDIASQLTTHGVDGLDGVLITHEHGDHYMGLDELFSYKRATTRGAFKPIPVYLTKKSWEVIGMRFGYLVDMGVIEIHEVEPNESFTLKGFEFSPFKTNHGSFAAGSIGYILKTSDSHGKETRLVYTSDFWDLPESPQDLFHPDYLIIQSFWLHEPAKNVPQHMSFQRALEFLREWQPVKETFLVHIGDGDVIPGDPANEMLKKNKPADPLRSPEGGDPYPPPLNQEQWQKVVDQIRSDFSLPYKITVAHDDLLVKI